jgi:hypothetical protein
MTHNTLEIIHNALDNIPNTLEMIPNMLKINPNESKLDNFNRKDTFNSHFQAKIALFTQIVKISYFSICKKILQRGHMKILAFRSSLLVVPHQPLKT